MAWDAWVWRCLSSLDGREGLDRLGGLGGDGDLGRWKKTQKHRTGADWDGKC